MYVPITHVYSCIPDPQGLFWLTDPYWVSQLCRIPAPHERLSQAHERRAKPHRLNDPTKSGVVTLRRDLAALSWLVRTAVLPTSFLPDLMSQGLIETRPWYGTSGSVRHKVRFPASFRVEAQVITDAYISLAKAGKFPKGLVTATDRHLDAITEQNVLIRNREADQRPEGRESPEGPQAGYNLSLVEYCPVHSVYTTAGIVSGIYSSTHAITKIPEPYEAFFRRLRRFLVDKFFYDTQGPNPDPDPDKAPNVICLPGSGLKPCAPTGAWHEAHYYKFADYAQAALRHHGCVYLKDLHYYTCNMNLWVKRALVSHLFNDCQPPWGLM